MNQPIFMAAANGAPTPVVTVRPQMPTRSFTVCAEAWSGESRPPSAKATVSVFMVGESSHPVANGQGQGAWARAGAA